MVLVCNGEIYNYQTLKLELMSKGYKFKTNSDSEVIVHGYEDQGSAFFSRLNGMFAFALWDATINSLLLARDPSGMKPLYYLERDKRFAFASEMKALVNFDKTHSGINEEVLADYLFWRYVPNAQTMYKDIKKLLPGQILVINDGTISEVLSIGPYASKIAPVRSEPRNIALLSSCLSSAVERHLMSEVPVGVFLSGGIDSSTIAGLSSIFSFEQIFSFCVYFRDFPEGSEVGFAESVARYYETNHHNVEVCLDDVIRELPLIAWHYGEPMGDGAVIPTYFVSKYAEKFVKVILAGEGSDEQFAGYDKYHQMLGRFRYGIVDHTTLSRAYRDFISVFSLGQLSLLLKDFDAGLQEHKLNTMLDPVFYNHQSDDELLKSMLLFDRSSMLAENYLMKGDKMTMAHGVEERAPFLDREILSFSSKLDVNLLYKISSDGLREKHILKKAVSGIIPIEIVNRKKKGYGTPTHVWLRNELGELFEKRIKRSTVFEMFFNLDYIHELSGRHRSGKEDHRTRIWSLLALDLWFEIFITRGGARPDGDYQEFLLS